MQIFKLQCDYLNYALNGIQLLTTAITKVFQDLKTSETWVALLDGSLFGGGKTKGRKL